VQQVIENVIRHIKRLLPPQSKNDENNLIIAILLAVALKEEEFKPVS